MAMGERMRVKKAEMPQATRVRQAAVSRQLDEARGGAGGAAAPGAALVGRLTAGDVLQLQRQIGNQAVQRLLDRSARDAPPVQRQLDDADKVGEDAVGFMRGPAAQAESATPQAERVNASGLIDGGIGTTIQPHAFTDAGRVGEGTWHHTGGNGGKGVESLGEATLVAPVIKTQPAGTSAAAKAWVKRGTGTVKVKRSFMGVTHGAQGAYTAPPPGTVWMSPRAKDRVDKHEREHTKKTKEIHDTHIKPLEERIANYRGFFKAKKTGADEPTARAALEAELDWNTAVTDFAAEDTAENTPMGPVDNNDMATADFYADYRPTKPTFQANSGCDTYEGVGGSRRGKT